MTSTLESIILDRTERGMGALLFEIYQHAYCAGAGIACDVPHSESMRQLLWMLDSRHRTEVLLPRGFDPEQPCTIDELPGWLLRLTQQADVVEGPPIEGWPL